MRRTGVACRRADEAARALCVAGAGGRSIQMGRAGRPVAVASAALLICITCARIGGERFLGNDAGATVAVVVIRTGLVLGAGIPRVHSVLAAGCGCAAVLA